ncbi:hypothetical protein GOBAR_AA01689 [Gossypium barbadense]|uniref:non-specific serine/threonine protein kinase n=1 Tax=Gossypium barbadense TaxID=3634 RepID=A0A2P5YTH4_GOSBA|nr:hypothetical protein GOBAR_AA01689 [Gossypium barbadense]
MLARDPKKRITAAEALEHPWVKKGGLIVLSLVISESLSTEKEIKCLQQMFKNIGTDGSVTITLGELGWILMLTIVELIDYIEFIAATMHRHRLEREEKIVEAFQFFDKDNSGFITRDELRQAMTRYGMGDEATIEDADTEKDFPMMKRRTHDGDCNWQMNN